jgi:hypothetical protein
VKILEILSSHWPLLLMAIMPTLLVVASSIVLKTIKSATSICLLCSSLVALGTALLTFALRILLHVSNIEFETFSSVSTIVTLISQASLFAFAVGFVFLTRKEKAIRRQSQKLEHTIAEISNSPKS